MAKIVGIPGKRLPGHKIFMKNRMGDNPYWYAGPMDLDYNPEDDYDNCDDCGVESLKTDLHVCSECLDVLCDDCYYE